MSRGSDAEATRRPFTSDLSTAEHHAVRSVGFVPVGQVLGASVYQLGVLPNQPIGPGCGLRIVPGPTNGAYFSPSGPPRMVIDTVDAPALRRARREIWARALGRLEEEAGLLGADGVVAVRVETRQLAERVRELVVLGTAVRSSGRTRPRSGVFSCALSGQDFASAVRGGLMPVRLVVGLAAMVRHDLLTPRDSWRDNVELKGFTALSTVARADARRRVAAAAAAAGASDFVLGGHDVELNPAECSGGGIDHRMVATLFGTALTRFAPSGGPAEPLPVLRVDARRHRHRDALALAARSGVA